MQGNSYSKQTLQQKKINYVVNTIKDLQIKQNRDGISYLELKFDMGCDEITININMKQIETLGPNIPSLLSLSEELRNINQTGIEHLRKKIKEKTG